MTVPFTDRARPEPFHAVGLHYRDFHQIDDAEVLAGLAEAAAERHSPLARR